MGIDWWCMKTTQSSGTRPDHQTVAGTLEFKSNGKAIAIGFTEQQLSPHAGSPSPFFISAGGETAVRKMLDQIYAAQGQVQQPAAPKQIADAVEVEPGA